MELCAFLTWESHLDGRWWGVGRMIQIVIGSILYTCSEVAGENSSHPAATAQWNCGISDWTTQSVPFQRARTEFEPPASMNTSQYLPLVPIVIKLKCLTWMASDWRISSRFPVRAFWIKEVRPLQSLPPASIHIEWCWHVQQKVMATLACTHVNLNKIFTVDNQGQPSRSTNPTSCVSRTRTFRSRPQGPR